MYPAGHFPHPYAQPVEPEEQPARCFSRVTLIATATTFLRQFGRSALSFGLGRHLVRPQFADSGIGEVFSGAFIGTVYPLVTRLFLSSERRLGVGTLSVAEAHRGHLERFVRVTMVAAFAAKAHFENQYGVAEDPQAPAVTGITGVVGVAAVLFITSAIQPLIVRPSSPDTMNLGEATKLLAAGSVMGMVGMLTRELSNEAGRSAMRLGTWTVVQELVILGHAIHNRNRAAPAQEGPAPAALAIEALAPAALVAAPVAAQADPEANADSDDDAPELLQIAVRLHPSPLSVRQRTSSPHAQEAVADGTQARAAGSPVAVPEGGPLAAPYRGQVVRFHTPPPASSNES